MKAFEGSIEGKHSAIKRAREYRQNDQFYAWGHYWHEGKGNVSGAMYHDHADKMLLDKNMLPYPAPDVHGIPINVATMADTFFAGLYTHKDKELYTLWAERFYEAIPEGADLTRVPYLMASHILNTPEWMLDYADERGAEMVDYMQAVCALCLAGIDQEKRVKDFYYDQIHGLHRHQLDGQKDVARYVYAAIRSLCGVERNPTGCWHYFLRHAVHGAAKHSGINRGLQWLDLSEEFLRIIRECE